MLIFTFALLLLPMPEPTIDPADIVLSAAVESSPAQGEPPLVVLEVEYNGELVEGFALDPSQARKLAAELCRAADQIDPPVRRGRR